MPTTNDLSFGFESLSNAYETNACTPEDVVTEVHRRIERDRDRLGTVWLHVRPLDDLREAAERLAAREQAGESLPLYGLPFAVKDNIDVRGMPTTTACPALAYSPAKNAAVVEKLIGAGAIVVGKTNLDQLANGLVGIRSPYGSPKNPFDPRMIPGGSSSGSAVAVAAGHVSFALGTDTAGSGRVPAAFNNIVGLKPTRGALSTRGVVPVCRSLDCVSIFALTVTDACTVAEMSKGWDPLDPFSAHDAGDIAFGSRGSAKGFRIGIPSKRDLVFFDDAEARAAYANTVERFATLGCPRVEVDLRPFRDAGALLYDGPWIAERLHAAGTLLTEDPEALLPVIRDLLEQASRYDALAAFEGSYRIQALKQATAPIWESIDALLLPTTPTIYRVDEVLGNPRTLNANLGAYSTFVNLMDLAALAIPGDFRSDGLPAGVTLVGPRGSDARLAAMGEAHHRLHRGKPGAFLLD